MNLPRLAVNRPVTTTMIFAAMVLVGLVAMSMLGLDFMPDLEIPVISVLTGYEGAAPQEVETLITEPLEDSLSTVSGIDEISSVSREGISAIMVKFAWGANIDEKANDVRDKVDLAKGRLPDEADDPIIFKFDLAMAPIMIIVATARESYPDLKEIIDDKVIDRLKRVNGVAAAIARGGLIRQIRIDIDRDRLAALNLSVAQIKSTLAAQNISLPGGNLRTGYTDYLIRTPEEFSSPDEVADVVIAQRNGTVVRLKDIAEVSDYFKEQTYGARVNGKMGMGLMIQKQSGTNTVDVAKRVTAELEKIKQNLPGDVDVKIVIDNSEFIISSVHNLRNTLLWAGLFVFLVILFFLRDIRASIIVAAAIPTSLIITFVLMWLAGYTINQDTLASLAVAVGLVVDNAIVVVDNIHRHRQRGQKPKEGAISGANEVGVAVLASTLTTISIFAPIVFVGGIAAIIFGPFAAIVSMALGASFFTAIMFVPMLSSKFMRINQSGYRWPIANSFYNWGKKFLDRAESVYVQVLNFSLANRKTILISCVLLFIFSLCVLPFVGTEFFPEQDQNRISARYELPIGTRYERTGAVAQKLQELVGEHIPEMTDSFIRWGVYGTDAGNMMGSEEASYSGFMFIRLKPKNQRDKSPRQIIEDFRPIAEQIPGAKIRFSSEDPLMGLIFGGGKQLAIDIYGHDLKAAREYAEQISTLLSAVEGVRDVEISRKEKKPELKVIIDRDKASSLGLNINTIGKTIETFFAGSTATKYREGGNEYDVEVRLRLEDRNRIEDVRDVFVTNSDGQNIALANIARIEKSFGPTKIERKDQSRIITVSADITGRKLSEVVHDVKKILDRAPAPPEFGYKFAGAEEEKTEAFRLLIGAVMLGMVLVYMVMASQFESFRDPFIIFLAIPFGIVGVIFALTLTGQALSVISFIALIMMVGIVVNNGIVLISYIGILRQRGGSVYEAIIEGGRSRLRPVLSTTFTTTLAMIPLALARGEGSEIWVPFAVTIIGGLSVGMVVTLVLMPTLYSIFEGMKKSAVVS